MESLQTPFNYKPLPLNGSEIRLITITPGETDTEVECVVSHYPFGKNGVSSQEYEALSYIWGEVTDTVCIKLNDKPFQTTRNLEAALRVLRDQDVQLLIWFDVICINQSSVEERNKE